MHGAGITAGQLALSPLMIALIWGTKKVTTDCGPTDRTRLLRLLNTF
jgi:hypothetical protein